MSRHLAKPALYTILALVACILPTPAMAADDASNNIVRIVVLTTALSFIPAFVLSVTSFTRIVVVFSFLKQGLGTSHVPPAPVLITLALILTAFASTPLLRELYSESYKPWESGDIDSIEALSRAEAPLHHHLIKRVSERDVAVFAGLRGDPGYRSANDVPLMVLVPAFMLGELRTSFRMGFSLLIPFVVIDLVVAAVLMTLGMMMLPPVLISLPIKIMVFVTVDGWTLLVESLSRSAA